MAALFAAEIQISLHHFLNDIAIANFRPDNFAADRAERFIEPEVAHHRGDQRLLREPAGFQEVDRGNGQDLVAIHQLAVFVAKQNAVGIAVMGDAELRPRFLHDALDLTRERAAAFRVDVCPVRLVVHDRDGRAQLAQNAGCRFVGGAVRHVHGHPHFL